MHRMSTFMRVLLALFFPDFDTYLVHTCYVLEPRVAKWLEVHCSTNGLEIAPVAHQCLRLSGVGDLLPDLFGRITVLTAYIGTLLSIILLVRYGFSLLQRILMKSNAL